MSIKLKCLLIDDELPSLTYLKMLCEQIPELDIVKVFKDPMMLIKEMVHIDFDLCIMDIEMPDVDGIQLANLMSGKMVIFTTAYSQYAVDAFEIDAVDYVKKPITKDRMRQAINKAIRRKEKTTETKKRFIYFNTDKGRTLLFLDQILYIKTSDVDSRDKEVLLQDRSRLILKNISFEKLLDELPSTDFCRINKSVIIALKSVGYLAHDTVTTSIIEGNGKPLIFHLSDVYKKELINKVKLN